MKSALWLIVGIGAGFVAAHQVNATPRGRAFFEDVSDRTKDLTDAIVDGYRSRVAKLDSGRDDIDADR